MNINKNKKIIIDVDTGVDDALAILLLHNYLKNQIIGITTSGGNASVEQTTINTLGVLSFINSNVKVYKGSVDNILGKKYNYALDYHGQNALMGINLPYSKKNLSKISADDFIVEMSKKHKDNLIVICLAPLTNLAKALKKYEGLRERVGDIYIMGGAINVSGNETKYAEFNFYQDPDAAKYVIENFRRIKLITLDVTGKCFLDKKSFDNIVENDITIFIKKIVDEWYGQFGDKKNRKFELYDPLAVSDLLGNFLKFKNYYIDIDVNKEKGRVLKGPYKIKYANRLESKKFIDFFISSFNSN